VFTLFLFFGAASQQESEHCTGEENQNKPASRRLSSKSHIVNLLFDYDSTSYHPYTEAQKPTCTLNDGPEREEMVCFQLAKEGGLGDQK
jgi:hypothetical protein